MTAAAIAVALGGARREGREWRCRCPIHGGRSLSLRDGDCGRILITCWGGCDRLDVLAELRGRGLVYARAASYLPPANTAPRWNDLERDKRIERALAIWREALPAGGTIVETYLRSRAIMPSVWPATVRFHPRCLRPRDDAGNFVPPLPAMVGLIEHVERGPVAIHACYLRPDGRGKAPTENAKAMFGPVGGGAVRLGNAKQDEWLVVGEGIETTLSVMLACELPGWAALSAGGIHDLVLPLSVDAVLICADNDTSGVGQRAAYAAGQRWLAEGRRVRIAVPPKPDQDFNAVLTSRTTASVEGLEHDAA